MKTALIILGIFVVITLAVIFSGCKMSARESRREERENKESD